MFKLKTNEVITHSQLADLFHVKTLKQSRFIKEFNRLWLCVLLGFDMHSSYLQFSHRNF